MTVLDSFRLDDKAVIVTGASSGLGVAFAQAFAEAGADVALGARRVEKMAAHGGTRRTSGPPGARRCQTDVADQAQCQALVDATVEAFGRVDILINNAGVGTAVPATRETPEQFRAVIDINLNGSFWMAQACGRVMQPGSAIINIASVLGITTGGPPQAAYAPRKAGVMGLTRDLAQQWGGRKGIRVNAHRAGLLQVRDDRRLQARLPGQPAAPDPVGPDRRPRGVGRHGGVAGVGGRGYVAGQTIVVDGGLTIS